VTCRHHHSPRATPEPAKATDRRAPGTLSRQPGTSRHAAPAPLPHIGIAMLTHAEMSVLRGRISMQCNGWHAHSYPVGRPDGTFRGNCAAVPSWILAQALPIASDATSHGRSQRPRCRSPSSARACVP
jgi:hypothetical protein